MKGLCVALTGILLAGGISAFAPASTPALRGIGGLRMATQAPPPAKLELPKAKLEAAAVNAKQWGTGGGAGGGDVSAAQMAADLKAAEEAGAAALPKAIEEQERMAEISSSFIDRINRIKSASLDKLK